MKDIEGALCKTLKVYKGLEQIRSSAFNKKVSMVAVENMQRIANEVLVIQNKYGGGLRARGMISVLSQKVCLMAKSPVLDKTEKRSESYLKSFVRESNSRLCKLRVGNAGRRFRADLTEDSSNVRIGEKERKKENDLEELFGQVHYLPKRTETSFVELKKVKECNKEDVLKRNVESLMRRMENSESTISRCMDSFYKIKERQNLEFLKKVQNKVVTLKPELAKRTNQVINSILN